MKEFCKDPTQPVVQECPDCFDAFITLAYAKEKRLEQLEKREAHLAQTAKEFMAALCRASNSTPMGQAHETAKRFWWEELKTALQAY